MWHYYILKIFQNSIKNCENLKDKQIKEWFGFHIDNLENIQLVRYNGTIGAKSKLYDCDEYPNPEDIKQQGTFIFFPSFIYHEANPVTSGIRHSLALWFEGPKWR